MACPVHNDILDALADRETWESKQEVFYRMRHEGLKRKRPPYPGAANLHFPLIDATIEKFKPFYYNQVFQGETLARFTSQRSDTAAHAAQAAEFHDYVLKERTRFAEELPSMIDYMLLRCRGVLKTWWCPLKKEIQVEAVDPLYLIVPSHTRRLDDADWIVEVKHLSVAEYQRDRRYDQDPDYLRKIRGGVDRANDQAHQDKRRREGLTYTRSENTVILWEVYQQTANGWTVYTYAPECSHRYARKPFGLTTKWQGRVLQPFVDFPFEVKDKGWYAPRGVAEKVAPFESWLCKLWNSKADNLDFTSKPLFTQAQPGGQDNLGKSRIEPGEVLPHGIQKVDMGHPPASIDQEMISVRRVSEEHVQLPDAGIGSEYDGNDAKTATEVQQIGALMNQGIEMRGGIFRARMAEFYERAWALMVHHMAADLAYWFGQESKTLPAKALHDSYMVHPAGSPDNWNPQKRYRKATARYNAFQGNPRVNQDELVKQVLEADDPGLVRRLFQPSGVSAANEAEDEAIEIGSLLMEGYPAQAMPDENHMLRIKIVLGKLQQLGATGREVDPVARQRMGDHLKQHLELLREQDAGAARQVEQAIQQMDGGESGEGGATGGRPRQQAGGER